MTSSSSRKTTSAAMLLVVILACSAVISNMVIFSADKIAKKADDLSVRMEVLGEDIVAVTQGKQSLSDLISDGASVPSASMEGGEEVSSWWWWWSPAVFDSSSSAQLASISSNNDYNRTKYVILAFDDGWKSQYENAMPILDKYHFKATFFIVCGYVGNPAYMSWREIRELHNAGHDIQSHSMTHRDLTKLTQKELEYDVGQSKKCLAERGIDATIFATPHNAGWNNATVINAIARHYEFAKNGNSAVMHLRCDGWAGYTNQTDCRTYNESDELNFANRYSIRTWSHNYHDVLYQHNDTRTFDKFVETVNTLFSSSDSVVVIEYHKVDTEKTPTSTSLKLFEAEMRYLADNGFSVVTMDAFEYDKERNYLYLSR